MIYLYIGIGGFLGAISRFALENLAKTNFPGNFPIGTFFINVVGCFLIGLIMTLALELMAISANLRMGIVTGYLGGLTTFSTYAFESVSLFHKGIVDLALIYVVGSVVVCMVAAWVGIVSARIIIVSLSKGAQQQNSDSMHN